MSEFAGVLAPMARALAARGYEALTEVQSAVIAPDLDGADLLVSAQTGSGKTVAFGLAVAPSLLGDDERLLAPDLPLMLAVAPTRELALQVARELEWLYAEAGAVIATCVGGMDPRTERRALERGAHVVVGTPGRLRDHITRHGLKTEGLRAVVLDEADEMLDLGFREDLEFILEATPEDRRTLMFSATVPRDIEKLARRYQRDAKRVSTAQERSQHADIEYQAMVVPRHDREGAISNVLRFHDAPNALVFCNTRAAVNDLVTRLSARGFAAVALSGELSQGERSHALQALRDGRATVCVATDVAARGIDLPNLELVIHFDLPSNPEVLLHRSGRTGRAGRKGISALIVDPKGRGKAERLLRFAKLDAEWASPPTAKAVRARDEERLLDDAALTEPADDAETAFAIRMLERFTPKQIAVAAMRFARAGQSAPDDLRVVPVEAPRERGERGDRGDRGERPEREKPERREFGPSQWISLSVGRKQGAEPKWLIPLLCNAGNITKREIGTIRMLDEKTFVQLDAGSAELFLESIGPDRTLEKNVRVTVEDGTPDLGPAPTGAFKKAARTGGKPKKDWAKDGAKDGPKKPWKKSEKADEDRPKGKPPSKGKTFKKDDKPGGPKSFKGPGGKKPFAKKPGGSKPSGTKPAGKKAAPRVLESKR